MRHRSFVVVGFATLAALGLGRVAGAQPAPSPLVQEGPTNTAVGQGALASNITLLGFNNTAVGAEALFHNTRGEDNTAIGRAALYSNGVGIGNTASGAGALYSNNGFYNTASGYGALSSNIWGSQNTASGKGALYSNTTGNYNTAIGSGAGANVTTGSSNIHIGTQVLGTAADTNTLRIGLPYESTFGFGQTRTFIAGIHGTQVPGSYLQVVINAEGQLGTLTPPVQLSGSATATPLSVLQQQVQGQQATIAAQQATIEDLLARLSRLEAASRASRRP